jgi:YD repeat-containing protein
MKPYFLKPSAISPLIILLWVLLACNKNVEAPASTCKLIQAVSMSSSDTGTNTFNSSLEYNDKGLLSGKSITSVAKDKSGNEFATGSSSESYQYDADGYIIKKIVQSQGNDKADGQYSRGDTYDYQYQNGRLIKETNDYAYTSKGKTETRNFISTYEYDVEGNNIKNSFGEKFNGVARFTIILYEWKDRKLAKITKIKPDGSQIVPFMEVNAAGLVIKFKEGAQTEYRFTYDNEGNILRQEYWDTGKKTGGSLTEYDTQKSLNKLLYPVFKGRPVNPDIIYGLYVPSTRNETKIEYFTVDNNGQEVLTSSTSIAFQYNSSGYPTNEVSTQTNAMGAVVTSGNTSYTYKDCQ